MLVMVTHTQTQATHSGLFKKILTETLHNSPPGIAHPHAAFPWNFRNNGQTNFPSKVPISLSARTHRHVSFLGNSVVGLNACVPLKRDFQVP